MRKLGLALALALAGTAVDAATLTVDCSRPGPTGRIGSTLALLNPTGPNTVNVVGTCRENVVVRGFDRLVLAAQEGAAIEDASGGQEPVLYVIDSRRIEIRGFRITGGFRGVVCSEQSLCRFTGNTIEGSSDNAVEIDNSEATFASDSLQDAGGAGLGLLASNVTAWRLTVQRTGSGIFACSGSVLTASELTAVNNHSDGVFMCSHSYLDLTDSTVSGNTGSGLSLANQSAALLLQDSITGNGMFGVAMGDLSLTDFYGGATVTGNTEQDIRCWGQYSVATHLENATYGTNDCPVP
jgi:hypothetical protein